MEDFFSRLGIARRYTLDLDEVERCYLARSRDLHPDFHHNASDADRQASLEGMAQLNEAAATLREPFKRLEHLLNLHGGPTAAQEKIVEQSFLMEMMELQESIDTAKVTGSNVDKIEADLTTRLRELLDAAGGPFDAIGPLSPSTLTVIRRQLNSAKTLMSLLRNLQAD